MITAYANRGSNIAGADEVFPLVVYAILKGNVRKLKSNMTYIQHYRHKTRLESAEEYYFINITSALEFIEILSHKKLNIKESDFHTFCDESDKMELERMRTPLSPYKSIINKLTLIGNNEENYLIYYLTSANKQDENKKNYIELTDFNHSVLMNTESTISKSLLYKHEVNVMHIDLERLYKEYFNIDFAEFSIYKLEKMFNDFKIVLRLIEIFRNNYYKTKSNMKSIEENNDSSSNTISPNNKNLSRTKIFNEKEINLIDI